MWSYLRNQRSKQTNLVYLQFLSNYVLFQKLTQKVVKKRTFDLEVYYIIQRNYRLTGHTDNFEIEPYYFQERL